MHQSNKEKIIQSSENRLLNNNLQESIQMASLKNEVEVEMGLIEEPKRKMPPKSS